MDQKEYFKIAAYQGEVIEKSPESALEKIISIMQHANNQQVDILCMPETFLQGYFTSKTDAMKYSIQLESDEFKQICDHFKPFKNTTLLLGLNEREHDDVYNTVVVIENGSCIGKYRKAYCDGASYALGKEFPVFKKRGVTYGIIICYDSWFREPAHIEALSGATIIFCPSFNRVKKDAHMLERLSKRNHFITRAYDNECWFVCSDIIWNKDSSEEVCPGYTCILDDYGSIMAVSTPFTETILTYTIPIAQLLSPKRKKRLMGTPDLFQISYATYAKKNPTQYNN